MSGLKARKRTKHAIGKKGETDESKKSDQFTINDKVVEGSSEKTQNKLLKNKKRKKSRKDAAEPVAAIELYPKEEGGSGLENGLDSKGHDNKSYKPRGKKSKDKKEAEVDHLNDNLVEESVEKNEGKLLKNKKRRKSGKDETELYAANELHQIEEGGSSLEYGLENKGLENEDFKPRRKKGLKKKEAGTDQQKAKLKKSNKMKNRIQSSKEEGNLPETKTYTVDDDVYQISSGDEDSSKGMKKWIMEYHQRRPGLNVLQERIDDFITDHESRVDQERKEKEAKGAEDGWTVVVHHKGRKKTTEADTGVTVGSVTLASAQDHQLSKKNKNKELLDFYRFQKREARKNEIMMLQSKFEQDKKHIQQMRAARKFRPY